MPWRRRQAVGAPVELGVAEPPIARVAGTPTWLHGDLHPANVGRKGLCPK
jgi:hypothetical protein